MNKKILILGGGQAQIGLIKTAKEKGMKVIVVGIHGDYPGYLLADKVYFEDIFNKDAVLKVAKEEKVDGISMVCSDFGLPTVGYVCDHMHLQGLSEKVAINSSNKMKMKQMMQEAGVNTAKFRIVRNDDEINDAINALAFPLIVKAVDLQGSRGIYICNSPSELLNNYRKSIKESRKDYCIVEEFIEGEEFGAQAFVYHGEVLFVQTHGDIVRKEGNTSIPIGHYMPLFDKEDRRDEIVTDLVKKAISALHFDNCAVNVDLIMKGNVPYIIELTGRAGANFLPELTGTYLGLNYYEMVLSCAVGESPKDYYNQRGNGASCVLTRQLYSTNSGLVKKLYIRPNSQIKNVEMFLSEGDKVNKFSNSNDSIGKVLCIGKNIEECMNTMESFIENDLHIEIE